MALCTGNPHRSDAGPEPDRRLRTQHLGATGQGSPLLSEQPPQRDPPPPGPAPCLFPLF